jgi:hypothetical protein
MQDLSTTPESHKIDLISYHGLMDLDFDHWLSIVEVQCGYDFTAHRLEYRPPANVAHRHQVLHWYAGRGRDGGKYDHRLLHVDYVATVAYENSSCGMTCAGGALTAKHSRRRKLQYPITTSTIYHILPAPTN